MPKLIIDELSLSNFKQHREFYQKFVRKDLTGAEFPSGLIGLIGDNGDGKTTVLDAIMFCFIGQVPGDTKDELLSWGATKGYARCKFKVDGDPAELYRELHSSVAMLSLRGKVYKGITAVNREIEEQLGLDKELCEQNIFVRQSEISDILFTEPAKRRKAWQKLVGMGKAEDMYNVLGTFLSGLLMTQVPDEDIARAKILIIDTRKQLAAIMARMRTVETQMNLTDVPTLQGVLSDCSLILDIKGKYDAWQREKSDAATHANTAANILLAARKEHDSLSTQYTELGAIDMTLTRITSLKADIQKADWAAKCFKELDSVCTDLQNCSQSLSRFDTAAYESLGKNDWPKQLSDIQTQIGSLISTQQTCADLLRAIGQFTTTSPVCPLCEQPITNMADLKAKLKTRVDELNVKIQGWRKSQDGLQQSINMETRQKHEMGTLLTTLTMHNQNLTKRKDELVPQVDGLKSDEELAAMRQELQTAEARVLRERVLRLKMVAASDKVKYLGDAEMQARKLYDRLNATAYPMPSNEQILAAPALQAAAQQKLNDFAAMQIELSGLHGQRTATRRSVTSSITQLRSLYERQANDSRKVEARKVLEEVRNFFHHTQGPLLVVAKILEDVTPGVNDFLRYFNAPYTVVPDYENIMFRCVFTDGRITANQPPPATKLSGGQKVALALAFRFATYYSLSSQMGFMTLDEPTIHLDKKNIENFALLMERVKTLTRDSGIQIVVSTHDDGVISVLDHVVDLRKKETQKALTGELR